METRKSIYVKKKVDILISYEPNDSSVKTSEARMWQNGKLFGLTQRYIVGPNSTSFWWMGVSMLEATGAEGVRKQAVKCARACVQMCVCVIEQAGINEL